MISVVVVLIIGICLVMAALAGERRYVAPSKFRGIEFKEYPLWTSVQAANSCGQALARGTKEDVETFCEKGFSGLKPKVGMLTVGTEVELLDSRECEKMVHVRVLTGALTGETGCVVGEALSSVKP